MYIDTITQILCSVKIIWLSFVLINGVVVHLFSIDEKKKRKCKTKM